MPRELWVQKRGTVGIKAEAPLLNCCFLTGFQLKGEFLEGAAHLSTEGPLLLASADTHRCSVNIS